MSISRRFRETFFSNFVIHSVEACVRLIIGLVSAKAHSLAGYDANRFGVVTDVLMYPGGAVYVRLENQP